MVLETVQSLKNRIIFKMNGQSQSGNVIKLRY